MSTQFQLAQGSKLFADLVGREREPVLKTDAFLAAPGELVELAARSDLQPAFGPAGGYPGLRAPLPDRYVMAVVDALAGPLAEAFSLGPVRPIRAQGAFSLVTLPVGDLVAPQRAPHVDGVDPMQFAILHYLCDAAFGGTSFYRHRATSFETLSEGRLSAYKASRNGEGTATGYVDDGAPWFERIGQVTAAPNRLVAYRSCLLHSGHVPSPEMLTADPRSGRLTANVFVTFARA